MNGTVAITDHGWYQFLISQHGLDEVNFWTPSAHWGFKGEVGAPFFFKLKAQYGHAICGFAYSRATPAYPIGWPGKRLKQRMAARRSTRCASESAAFGLGSI